MNLKKQQSKSHQKNHLHHHHYNIFSILSSYFNLLLLLLLTLPLLLHVLILMCNDDKMIHNHNCNKSSFLLVPACLVNSSSASTPTGTGSSSSSGTCCNTNSNCNSNSKKKIRSNNVVQAASFISTTTTTSLSLSKTTTTTKTKTTYKNKMLYLIPSQSIKHYNRHCNHYHQKRTRSSSNHCATRTTTATAATTADDDDDYYYYSSKKEEIYDEEAGDVIIVNNSKCSSIDTNTFRSKNQNCTNSSSSNYTDHTVRSKKQSRNHSTNTRATTTTTTTTTNATQTKHNTNNNTSNNNDNNNNIKPKNNTTRTPRTTIHKFRYNGNLPDIHWRAIPMDHLRLHPNYKPLPPPQSITSLKALEDVRYFRQDSWQWDILHNGRCTTSQASQALGLLEPNAAKSLGIPRSLQKGCMGAYRRLGQKALRTLDEMNIVLCCHNYNSTAISSDNDKDDESDDTCSYNSNTDIDFDDNIHIVDFDDNDDYEKFEAKFRILNSNDDSNNSNKIQHKMKANHQQQQHHHHHHPNKHQQHIQLWKRVTKTNYPFAARYQIRFTKEQLTTRRAETKQYMSTLSSPMRIRMNWGNSQEATAILTALNYFYSIDRGVTIREVGMCGAGLKYNSTCYDNSNKKKSQIGCSELILGASPDAVIEYSNGTIEVLEVKNHCPFVPARKLNDDENANSNTAKNERKTKDKANYRIREMPMKASVPPVYIPQLMMEMMCLGDECKSAVMCRQTATNGAILIRVWRDDEWINEMIYWLERFVNEYVNAGQPPPQNFFWFDENKIVSKRYQEFIQRTKELSEEVELVQCIPHNSIQRVVGSNGIRLPLFLD